jgi:hypothetical protein
MSLDALFGHNGSYAQARFCRFVDFGAGPGLQLERSIWAG